MKVTSRFVCLFIYCLFIHREAQARARCRLSAGFRARGNGSVSRFPSDTCSPQPGLRGSGGSVTSSSSGAVRVRVRAGVEGQQCEKRVRVFPWSPSGSWITSLSAVMNERKTRWCVQVLPDSQAAAEFT